MRGSLAGGAARSRAVPDVRQAADRQGIRLPMRDVPQDQAGAPLCGEGAGMSALEEEFAVQLRGAGIPFKREWKPTPLRRWSCDFQCRQPDLVPDGPGVFRGLYPRLVVVEIQGGGQFGGHGTNAGMARDCEKLSALAILGHKVVLGTRDDVRSGRLLTRVECALGLRSVEEAFALQRKSKKTAARLRCPRGANGASVRRPSVRPMRADKAAPTSGRLAAFPSSVQAAAERARR